MKFRYWFFTLVWLAVGIGVFLVIEPQMHRARMAARPDTSKRTARIIGPADYTARREAPDSSASARDAGTFAEILDRLPSEGALAEELHGDDADLNSVLAGPTGGLGTSGATVSHSGHGHAVATPGDQPPEEPARSDANSIDALLDEIDRKLNSLPLGNIAFNTPEEIPYGEIAAIELLVSLAETEEQLRRAVRALGGVESASVKVSPYMEATLNGAGFRIESSTPSRQMLSRTERTRWRWQIEPTKADALELTLTLSALFTVAGDERARTLRTFEKTIRVDVPFTQRAQQIIGENRELLLTVLVIPVAGALYRRFRKKPRRATGMAHEMDRHAA